MYKICDLEITKRIVTCLLSRAIMAPSSILSNVLSPNPKTLVVPSTVGLKHHLIKLSESDPEVLSSAWETLPQRVKIYTIHYNFIINLLQNSLIH